MQANLAAHLLSVLRDNSLYASILSLDSQTIAELSQALTAATNVAKNTVLLRCNEEQAS
jgi:hypothetical protein